MKFIKTYPSASATRPGAAVGTATRKYAIMVAMGLTASIASAVLAAVDTPTGRGGRVSNSFVTVEGEGVGVLDDGSISYDEGATGDIIVTARPGWRVNGQKSVTLNPARGSRQPLGATSDLHEDQEHIHFFQRSESDEHVPDTYMEISAEANPASAITMYALPDTSTVVTVSATKKLVKTASHRKVTRYYKCACGAVHDPEVEYGAPYEVKPDRYVWKASGPGASFADSTWTGEMSKGLAQKIEFTVKAKRSSCTECDCEAKAEATVDVHELSIERPDYIGLNLTDAMRGKYVTRDASAKIDPAPAKAEYDWLKCGKCEFIGKRNKSAVTYGATDKTGPSGSYLAEELVVEAVAFNKDGLSTSTSCTTNFTVVKVDVKLGGVDEDEEETKLPGVYYCSDNDDGSLSDFGKESLHALAVTCQPENLPSDEIVGLSISPNAKLYEINGTDDPVESPLSYSCSEINGKSFGIHGHFLSDGSSVVGAGHEHSAAIDKALFKVVPPPPLEVSVKLESPAEGGGWPYDPVWDDPYWEPTVDGSSAEKCAGNTDVALIIYNLSRDARKVDGCVYQDRIWPFTDIKIYPFQGVPTGGEHTNGWPMAASLDPDSYYAKIVAKEIESENERDAESNSGYLKRDTFFVSNASDGMIGTPCVITFEEYKSLKDAKEAGSIAFDIAFAKLPAVLSVAISVLASGDMPSWYFPGTRVYTVSWCQSRCMWKDGKYTEPFGPSPETWEVGYVDVKYAINDREHATEKNFYSKSGGKVLNWGADWPWEPKYARGLSQPYIVPPEIVNKEN